MKKKSFLIIIVCILFLTGCGCQKKEESPGANNSNKVEESNNNSNGTSNIENSNSNVTASNSNSNGNGSGSNTGEVPYTLTAAEKEISKKVILSFTPIYTNTQYSKLSDKEKIKLVANLTKQTYFNSLGKANSSDPKKVYTKKKLTNVLHKYFGSSATMNFVDYQCYVCGKTLYKYDNKKGVYVNASHANHTNKKQIILRKSSGVYKKGNIIRVKYITIFSDYVENEFPKSFYATYSNAEKKKKPVIKNTSKYCKSSSAKKYNCNIDKMVKENKFYTYVYNFEKKGNEFNFIGYQVEV